MALKAVSVAQIMADLRQMLDHFLPQSIEIVSEYGGDTDVILADAGQIHQALLNLVMNARDAMEKKGVLIIRQMTLQGNVMEVKFPSAENKPYVAVCVSDTGTGMDESVLARIFDPFFSTKERDKGTGLGLAMVQGIVNNHHGFIDVVSTPGIGTTFTMYFPALMNRGVEQSVVGGH